MNSLIIDNEPYVVDAMKQLIAAYCPEIKVLGSGGTIKKALELISIYKIDLLFLDVELDDGTGIDLLRKLDKPEFSIVFVTAYDQYAVQAFRFAAADYLLKPLDPDDLIKAVNKVKESRYSLSQKLKMEVLLNNVDDLTQRHRKIIIVNRESVHALHVERIFYLKADGAYTEFHTTQGRIISSKNLKAYEELLSKHHFFRTHHSFLVNLRYLVRFDKLDSVLILDNGTSIPVSQRKRDSIIEEIKRISLK